MVSIAAIMCLDYFIAIRICEEVDLENKTINAKQATLKIYLTTINEKLGISCLDALHKIIWCTFAL